MDPDDPFLGACCFEPDREELELEWFSESKTCGRDVITFNRYFFASDPDTTIGESESTEEFVDEHPDLCCLESEEQDDEYFTACVKHCDDPDGEEIDWISD